MKVQNEIKSVLNMDKLIIEKAEFSRVEEDFSYDEMGIEVGRKVEKIDALKYKVSLETTVKSKEGYVNVYVKTVGWFSLDAPLKDSEEEFPLLRNAVAIMFPFVRSQITLVTSQPNMQPVVLPPININSLIEE